MNTLVIHPFDKTTRFLTLAYRGLDATVITRPIEPRRLRAEMEKADRIMMMGHGSTVGLFNTGSGHWPYIIDHSCVDLLRERDNSIFIWCHADQFVRRHKLRGFSTGMFVSEMGEADWFRVSANETEIAESNHLFANIVGRFAGEPIPVLAAAVKHEYGRLAECSEVARYNIERMISGYEGARGWDVLPLHPGPTIRSAPVFKPSGSARAVRH